MNMRRRTLIVGIALVALLALGGIGVAMAAGWPGRGLGPQQTTGSQSQPGYYGYGMMGNSPYSGTPGAYGPNGQYGPHGPYGPGGMMGTGGMMGGYWQDEQQNPSQATPATGVTQVTMQNFAFQPANIQVKAGTTVTWTNQDTAPHTVTFRNGTKGSGMLQQGQSFSYKFTTPGTYDYYCAVHPNMVGTVTVTS